MYVQCVYCNEKMKYLGSSGDNAWVYECTSCNYSILLSNVIQIDQIDLDKIIIRDGEFKKSPFGKIGRK